MSLLTNEEKAFLQEAVNVYLQLVQQKLPRDQVQKYLEFAEGIIDKLEQADAGGEGTGQNKPRGISDEWFQKCCQACDKLAPGGRCLDKITEKFPGKCDPIILYERAKPVKGK
jgi:hypothetical protein